MQGDFRPPGPQMLLVMVLAVGQEQPSVVQHCWAIMGKTGPWWACTGPFTLLSPLPNLRSGAGQARLWVSLWNKHWPQGPGGDSRVAERRDRPQTTVEVLLPLPPAGAGGSLEGLSPLASLTLWPSPRDVVSIRGWRLTLTLLRASPAAGVFSCLFLVN